jgi:hypothetical protein
MLATIENYVDLRWHLPLALALAGGWGLAATLLLRRGVRQHLQRRASSFGRCAGVVLLAAALAAFSGAVVAFLVLGLGKFFDWRLRIPAVALGGAAMLVIAYFVLWAMLRLPGKQTLRLYAIALVAPALPVALALIPVAHYSYALGQKQIRESQCILTLQRLHQALYTHYRGQPPASLDRVVADNMLREAEVHCPAAPGAKSMYFYCPSVAVLPPGGTTRRLIACDTGPHHGGNWCVLFANGKAQSVTQAQLASLLEDKDNLAFKYYFGKAVTWTSTLSPSP